LGLGGRARRADEPAGARCERRRTSAVALLQGPARPPLREARFEAGEAVDALRGVEPAKDALECSPRTAPEALGARELLDDESEVLEASERFAHGEQRTAHFEEPQVAFLALGFPAKPDTRSDQELSRGLEVAMGARTLAEREQETCVAGPPWTGDLQRGGQSAGASELFRDGELGTPRKLRTALRASDEPRSKLVL
jgi:hypothetical protein